MNRFGVERGASRPFCMKLGVALVGLSAVCLSSAWAAQAQPHMALGLIVKLKESAPQSVVRLSASVRPSDGERAQRQRLYSASSRARVGFTAQKPTAFGAHVIHSGRITTVAEAESEAQRLRQDPDVEWVVVNQYEKPSAVARVSSVTPSLNAAYNDQYWLKDKAAGGAGVAGFSTAWALINGSGRQLGAVVTAVLDTGVLAPPEVQGRLASPGYDFVSQASISNDGNGVDPDPSDPGDYNYDASLCGPDNVGDSTWHGTMVSGVLTSPANNNRLGPGVLSVLPGAVVLPVRIGGPCGAVVSDIVEGMLWAAGVDYQGAPSTINSHPARVINLSFGGRDSITEDGSCLASTSTGALYRSTVSILRQKGAVVVASAGNGKSNGTYSVGGQSRTRFTGYRTPGRPASCEGVVAVTALRSDGTKSEYANLVDGNVGSAGYVGLAVAGGDPEVPEYLKLIANAGATTPDATYYLSNEAGTSFAAPQVAGLIALMFAIDPSLTAQQAIDLVTGSVTSFTNPGAIQSCSVNTGSLRGHCACDTATCGAGIVDAGAAVTAALAGVAGRSSTDTSADFVSPTLYASFFTPNRVLYNERARPGSGGGGGASELSTLLPLVGVAIFMLVLPAWQRFQRRSTSGERFTSGKR